MRSLRATASRPACSSRRDSPCPCSAPSRSSRPARPRSGRGSLVPRLPMRPAIRTIGNGVSARRRLLALRRGGGHADHDGLGDDRERVPGVGHPHADVEAARGEGAAGRRCRTRRRSRRRRGPSPPARCSCRGRRTSRRTSRAGRPSARPDGSRRMPSAGGCRSRSSASRSPGRRRRRSPAGAPSGCPMSGRPWSPSAVVPSSNAPSLSMSHSIVGDAGRPGRPTSRSA